MKIIFLTLVEINSIEHHGIYTDLMRKFRDEGHRLFVVSPTERKAGQNTHMCEVDGVQLLKVRTLNIKKTNVVEKGLGTMLLESQFKRAIHRYFKDIPFDLILYSTPPITFTNVVKYLKQRNPRAASYLLLKDIFPQNAVDIGMFGEKSLFNWYFRRKEIALYKISDFIGCMSPANVEFIHKHHPYYPADRVEVAPNSIQLTKEKLAVNRAEIRKKYKIPTDVPVFIYGGNLGKPQGISFLISCLEANRIRKDCHFVVIGKGTEYPKLENWVVRNKPCNVTLMKSLPKEEYDQLAEACDVGLIFLDHRFTIPNYPSRLLSYLQSAKPILCATDPNTDIGRIAEENGYGYWCESNDVDAFTSCIQRYINEPMCIPLMGQRGYEFLKSNYLVEHTYNAIIQHF